MGCTPRVLQRHRASAPGARPPPCHSALQSRQRTLSFTETTDRTLQAPDTLSSGVAQPDSLLNPGRQVNICLQSSLLLLFSF